MIKKQVFLAVCKYDLLGVKRVNPQEIFPGKEHLVIRNGRPSNVTLPIDLIGYAR